MGSVYQLSCPECGFQSDVEFGLGAMCAEIHALAQDTVTGRLRKLRVTQSEVLKHSGRDAFRTDQEWADAVQSCIAARLSPTESEISPGQAVCPTCRREMSVQSRGIM
jgi:hypothetical protein